MKTVKRIGRPSGKRTADSDTEQQPTMCFDDPACPHLYFAEKGVAFALTIFKDKNGEYELALPKRIASHINLTQTDIDNVFKLFHHCRVGHVAVETSTSEVILHHRHPNSPNHLFGLLYPFENAWCLLFFPEKKTAFGAYKHIHPLMSMYETPDFRVASW